MICTITVESYVREDKVDFADSNECYEMGNEIWRISGNLMHTNKALRNGNGSWSIEAACLLLTTAFREQESRFELSGNADLTLLPFLCRASSPWLKSFLLFHWRSTGDFELMPTFYFDLTV